MKKLNKGENLERIAHQFLWERGYLPFHNLMLYETKVKGTGSLEVNSVTDLDVFGVHYGSYLEKRTFFIDCKHRSLSAYQQILKAKGIALILDIDNLLILRSSVPEIVQQFADRFQIPTLAVKSFQKRVRQREYGSFSEEAFIKVNDFSNNVQKELTSLNFTLSSTILQPDPFVRVKKIIGIYQDTKTILIEKELWNKDLKSTYYSYFVFRVFQQLQLAISDIASLTIHLSPFHLRAHVLRRSIGDIQLKLQLFSDVIDEISDENEDFSEKESEKGPLWKIAPSFTKDLLEVVIEINKRPEFLQKYLMYVDFIFHDSFLLNQKFDFSHAEKELGNLPRELLVKWSTLFLKVLDNEKTYPTFMVKLLA